MGVYSWVEHHCSCGGIVQFQTKVGPKEYGTYPIDEVPFEVAQDIKDSCARCDQCGKGHVIIVAPRDIATVPMKVI